MKSTTRRTLTRTVLPILIVLGLVAATTFVYQVTSHDSPTSPLTSANAPSIRLTFPETSVEVTRDFPLHSTGNMDFWFRNSHPNSIEMGLKENGCVRCTRIRAALMAPESLPTADDWTTFQRRGALNQTMSVGTALEGLPGALVPAVAAVEDTHRWLGEKLLWQPIDFDHSMPVPPGATGVVRITWEALRELEQSDRLMVKLWTRPADSSEAILIGPELSVRLRFVRPIHLEPERGPYEIGDVDKGQHPSMEFLCWSSSLASFELKARTDSPCVVATCRPLTQPEIALLEQEVHRRSDKDKDTRVRSAYAVKVTVHERQGEKQLDMGPFSYDVHLSGDVSGEDAYPPVSIVGVVKGEVMVTSPAPLAGRAPNQYRIALVTFRADRPRMTTATIVAEEAGTVVSFDEPKMEPPALKDILDVKLLPQKSPSSNRRPSWDLEVRIPANRLHGPLPQHSAILLKLQGPSPRRIRIPITGQGYTDVRPH